MKHTFDDIKLTDIKYDKKVLEDMIFNEHFEKYGKDGMNIWEAISLASWDAVVMSDLFMYCEEKKK